MRLFWLGLAWLAGIGAGKVTSLELWQWLVLAAGSFSASLVFRRHPPYRNLFIGLLLLTMGAGRYVFSQSPPGPDHIVNFNDTVCRVSITGVIVGSPDVRDSYTGLRLSAEHLSCKDSQVDRDAHGLVLVRADRFGDWAYGDRVRVTGVLETPPVFETFSYRDYLARQGIHSIMPIASVTILANRQGNPILQTIFDLRERSQEVIYTLFPDPEASLLSGILLGVESGISPDVRQAFNDTGTTHIIAISGFNITIIAALFISMFGRWLGARRGAIAAALAIFIYTIFVGADAAVVRAAVMGGLSLLARQVGRQTHGMASLSAAAVVMTMANPLVLWDVGFQLSFAAALGLILYAEPLKAWFIRFARRWLSEDKAERLAGPVGEFVLFTFAAQVTTLPLMMYYFSRFSLVSFLANPVILPVQPPVMILGGLATLSGILWLPLGRPLAWIAWPFVAFTIRAVEFFARLPIASIPLGRMSLLAVASLYLLLFGTTVLAKMPTDRYPFMERFRTFTSRLNLPTGFGLAALTVLTSLTWRMAADQPDGRLHLTVFDVGGGDAVLIQSPTGRFVLVNGGPSPIALSEALGRRLPSLDRGIDWMVIAGTRDDQITGLAGVVDRFPVSNVLLSGPPGRSIYRRLMDSLSETGTPVISAQEGQSLDLGGGAHLEVTALGDQGAILLLSHGRARILLAQGADPASVGELTEGKSIGSVSAVLLADGGYLAVNPPELLAQLEPWVAMISVEAGNSRDLPSLEVMEALEGTTTLRTDQNGWIELTSDGERLWVEVERYHDPKD